MRQDNRAPFLAALERARQAAFPAGEYVGQESFMRAGEIRELAVRAGVGPGSNLLDLCCGVAGPGRMIASEMGCRYLGRDYSASAVAIARGLAGDLPCHFEQGRVPPLPEGHFDVVMLLETMLAFPDKQELLAAIATALGPGGRFAFTIEAGRPLTPTERTKMPDADTVWLIELRELNRSLEDVGLSVNWKAEYTASHRATAKALLESFRSDSWEIAGQIGAQAIGELISSHELWSDWLASGRVRKYALVATKR